MTFIARYTIIIGMERKKQIDISLKILTGASLAVALMLTFTVSDYYIFNRISEFGFFFCLSQWVKKAGLLLLPLAVYYGKKSCADIAKCVLPPFVILSCCIFGGFFDITKPALTPQQEIYNLINLFIPKAANITMFFLHNALTLAVCALLFARDYKIAPRSFLYLAPAMLLTVPLNIFENFFDISEIPQNSFLRFKNFSVWHFAALAALVGVTVGAYYFLRGKNEKNKDSFLGAIAIALLIQYHSTDSMLLGDGYNVYDTITAVVPLFICNIGVYIASVSVFAKNKILYAISFFVHAAGAVSVFVYFGRDDMSNFGIFCSYSFLYFCITHVGLFVLSVMPTALGRYKFKYRDCLIPLGYYFGVIIIAAVSSALVTSAAETWHTPSGVYLDTPVLPNYAFTQLNPFPFTVPPVWTITVWNYDLNCIYLLGLYAVYVAIFFAFNGFYYAFLAVRKKILAKKTAQK